MAKRKTTVAQASSVTLCPKVFSGYSGGQYHYTTYNCPLNTVSGSISSSTQLTIGCSSPDCYTQLMAARPESCAQFVDKNAYLETPHDFHKGWESVPGIITPQCRDCRFTAPSGTPAAGETITCRLFLVHVTPTGGPKAVMRLGAEMSGVAETVPMASAARVAPYPGQPYIFEVTFEKQTYAVLTLRRRPKAAKARSQRRPR